MAQQSEATPWVHRQGEQRPCMGRTIPTDCGTPSEAVNGYDYRALYARVRR